VTVIAPFDDFVPSAGVLSALEQISRFCQRMSRPLRAWH